jgi:hypothetical protein
MGVGPNISDYENVLIRPSGMMSSIMINSDNCMKQNVDIKWGMDSNRGTNVTDTGNNVERVQNKQFKQEGSFENEDIRHLYQ